MKSPTDIRARISRLLVRELRRRLAEAEERLPTRCHFNYRHPLDPRKMVDGEPNPKYNQILPTNQTIGLCMYGAEKPDEWPGNICEDPVDAQRCPYFQAKRTKQEVWVELRGQLQEPLWAEKNLPEVAALAWTLNERPDLEEAATHVDGDFKEPEPESPIEDPVVEVEVPVNKVKKEKPPPTPRPYVVWPREPSGPPWYVRLWRFIFGGPKDPPALPPGDS